MKTLLPLLALLASSQIFAQTSGTSVPSTAGNTSSIEMSSFSLQNIRSRTKISYFSETLGPSFSKWDDNEVDAEGERQRFPVRTFHSMNTQFRLAGNFSLFLSPRFITVIGDRNELRKNDDQHVFQPDDSQFGFQYEFVRRPDLVYQQRLTHRAPISSASKDSSIDSQIEWTHVVTWQPAPKKLPGLRVLHWNNYRYYKYEPQIESERYRINFNTIFNYDFNDKWRTQVMYELDMQHRNPTQGPKERDRNFFKKNENHLSFGVGYSPIKDFSIIPFVRAQELADVRNENTIYGLWLLGRVL